MDPKFEQNVTGHGVPMAGKSGEINAALGNVNNSENNCDAMPNNTGGTVDASMLKCDSPVGNG